MALISKPVSLFFTIVVLGYMLGRIKVKSFYLGASSVLFVAIIFGHLGNRLPPHFKMLGLVLFIYAIGLQAGPGFVSSLKQNGLALTAGALTTVAFSLLVTLICSELFNFDLDITAGLFEGAMTSTPGLAVAVETIAGSAVTAAYGVTYVFGVMAVVVFFKLLPKLTRTNIETEELKL